MAPDSWVGVELLGSSGCFTQFPHTGMEGRGDVDERSHPAAVRVYREGEHRDKAERKQYEAARRRLAKATKTVADVSDVRECRGSAAQYYG